MSEHSFDKDYQSLNVDIDEKWLNNNKIVTEKLFGMNHRIVRENISILGKALKNYALIGTII